MDNLTALSNKTQRRYDLDWLRVLAFSLLIFYHTGMFFVSWEWHIKNNVLSEMMELPMQFLSQWRMPLLFFISGAGVYFALGKRSKGMFMRERLKRILVPLIFGMLVIVPPQIYFERLTQGATFSYLEFYPSVFEAKPYPEGNFSWHHLWYLAYILTYSFLCLPLFLYLRGERGKKFTTALTTFFERKGSILLLVLPFFVSDALLRPYWPTQQNLIADWANFTFSLIIFIYGFLICSNERFWQIIEDNRQLALVIALVTVTIMYVFYWISWPEPSDAGMVLYWFCRDINIWCWLLAILGFSRKYLNVHNKYLQYANEAVYPFYILHQTLIIILAYYLMNWQAGVAVKFIIISTATFLICWFMYAFIIRSSSITRLLFGLKIGAKHQTAMSVPPVKETTITA
jgi:glucans biosynthesis protein C